MDNRQLTLAIRESIKKRPTDIVAYQDFFDLQRAIASEEHKGNVKPTFDNIRWLRDGLMKELKKGVGTETTIKMYELLRKTYFYMARDDFESFMYALEWERKPQERFYQPRAKIMHQLTVAIQELIDGDLDELFLSQPPRTGKALANDTPVLTPGGWKKHGDLKIGDKVFCPDGTTANIIFVAPKCKMTHKVTMTNGAEFICHANHEWRVWDRRSRKEKVFETHEMIGHLENGGTEKKRGHRYNFQLLDKEVLKGEHKELPVKPYTLGAWLGDGTNRSPRITGDKNDKAIIDAVVNEGYEIAHVYTHATTGVISTDFATSLRKDLRKIGLCNSQRTCPKYIPDCYLTASVEQRLELLAGMLDTDGCLIKKEHRYQFSTTEERLRDGIVALISTFGWRTCVTEHDPHTSSFGIEGKKKYWVVAFNPTFAIPCRLERKQLNEFSPQRRIAIKSIEAITEDVEGNCISLDRADGMYLAGEQLTPTHNTSFLMFLMCFLIGKEPERSNLYSAFSDTITKAFYNGVLEVIQDESTYRWREIFPDRKIVTTNSAEETLNIDRKKRYPSLTARSLYGTLNGACDCNGFLVSDDLIGGIEEALNKDRLMSAWAKVDNNLIPRAKESAKLLWCGTRWSVADPAGIRINALSSDSRFSNRHYKVINLPALNEKGESNFDYPYGVGFSTEYYLMRQASFEKNNDMASWQAQYMGQPVERSGVLFEPSEMRYFNGELPPKEEILRVFMAVDPAYGGGDFTAAPVCVLDSQGDVYVVDVVFSNGDKRITQPEIVNKIAKWGVKACQFECTVMTVAYKEKVCEMLKEQGIRCNVTHRAAPTQGSGAKKEIRIFDRAPEIREHFVFLDTKLRDKAYNAFMQNVFGFSINGVNKHDDAPDSLAMVCDMMANSGSNVRLLKRII